MSQVQGLLSKGMVHANWNNKLFHTYVAFVTSNK